MPTQFPKSPYHFLSHQKCIAVLVLSTVPSTLGVVRLGIQQYFMVVFICNSLMTTDAQFIFTCLFSICTFCSVRCLLRYFAQFLLGPLISYCVLSSDISLYVLNSLSKVGFVTYFSQFMVCLFILLKVPVTQKKLLIFIK